MYHKASGRMWLVQDHDCAHEDTGNPCAPKNWFVERSENASVLSEAERRETADMFKLHAQGKWGLNGLILPESKEKNISKNRRHVPGSKPRLWLSQALGSRNGAGRSDWRSARYSIPGLALSRLQGSGDGDVEMGGQ
jgi:hypothetical protein